MQYMYICIYSNDFVFKYEYDEYVFCTTKKALR